MDNEPTPPTEPKTKKKIPVLALTMGFLPSVLVLIFILLQLLFSSLASANISLEDIFQPIKLENLFLVGCVISVICGIWSAVLLFKRKTGFAIAGGIALLFLNGFISYAFLAFAALTAMFGGSGSHC